MIKIREKNIFHQKVHLEPFCIHGTISSHIYVDRRFLEKSAEEINYKLKRSMAAVKFKEKNDSVEKLLIYYEFTFSVET